MWLLYQLAMAAALIAAAPVLFARRGGHYVQTLRGRLGGGPTAGSGDPSRGRLWIHAVSVGEVAVAATASAALPPGLPLLVTTVTPTGQARARAAFASPGDDAHAVAYLPFDFGFAIARFFRRHAPRALILVEGDYWPLVLRRARRDGLPIAVINGRVGSRTFRRWRALRRIAPAVFRALGLEAIDRFGVQTEEDASRLRALGVDAARIVVTGNLKYDTPAPAPLPALEAALRALAGGRPILIAGSTMQGEDEPVLDAFARLVSGSGAGRALLVLVPRHPERWDAALRLIEARGLVALRRSALDLDAGPAESEAPPDVVLLDSVGELAALYRIADGAFIGGTLVATGGHNPLEPARFGVPIAAGPSMHNFREMAEAFDDAEAWVRVADADALAACWDGWLRDPAAARALGARAEALVAAGSGALERTRALLAPWLPADLAAAGTAAHSDVPDVDTPVPAVETVPSSARPEDAR